MKKRGSNPPSCCHTRPWREQKASGDDADLANRVALPAAKQLESILEGPLERDRQHRGEAEEAPERQVRVARARVERTVRQNRATAVEAVLGMASCKRREVIQTALSWTTVSGLRRSTYSPTAALAATFTPAAKPTFASSATRRARGKSQAQHRGRPVAGGVVDDDDFVVESRGAFVH